MIPLPSSGHPKACGSLHSLAFTFQTQNRALPGPSLQLSCVLNPAHPQDSCKYGHLFLKCWYAPLPKPYLQSETHVCKKAEATACISLLQSTACNTFSPTRQHLLKIPFLCNSCGIIKRSFFQVFPFPTDVHSLNSDLGCFQLPYAKQSTQLNPVSQHFKSEACNFIKMLLQKFSITWLIFNHKDCKHLILI